MDAAPVDVPDEVEVEQPPLPTDTADVIRMFRLNLEDIDKLTTLASDENHGNFIDPISHEIMLFPMKLDNYEQYRFEHSIIMEALARKRVNPMTNLRTAGNLALDILFMKNIHTWIFNKLSNQADFPNHDLSNIRIVDNLKPEDRDYYQQMGLSVIRGASGPPESPPPPEDPPPAIGSWWKKFAVSALALGMMGSRYSGTSSEVDVTSTSSPWDCSNAGGSGRCRLKNPIQLTRMEQKAEARGIDWTTVRPDKYTPSIAGRRDHHEYVSYSEDNIGDGTANEISEHDDLPQGVYITRFGEWTSLDNELPSGGWRQSAQGPAWLDGNILHVKLFDNRGRVHKWEGEIDKGKIYENADGNLREAPVEGCESIDDYRNPGIKMQAYSSGGEEAINALPIAWKYPNGFLALTNVDGDEVPGNPHLRKIDWPGDPGLFTPIDQLPAGPWKEYATEIAWVEGDILHAKLLQPDQTGDLSLKPPDWEEYHIMPDIEYGNVDGDLVPLVTDAVVAPRVGD